MITTGGIQHNQILHHVAGNVVSKIEHIKPVGKFVRFPLDPLALVEPDPVVDCFFALLYELSHVVGELADFSANSLGFPGLNFLVKFIGMRIFYHEMTSLS